ncbi:hypothetical protein GUJ93_ZPchr0007g3816 [Zizania palustris]|uniref:Uncharacterized protein n=1 Tax=Zizania palustris TaxID=103762 RepID=A0A8J5TIA7_ZIZPA|nr:hypothetical protein GUJ93_ZPchr0007g3816 [Zizania palustris]
MRGEDGVRLPRPAELWLLRWRTGGGSPLYPRIGQPSHGFSNAAPPPPRAVPYNHHGFPFGSLAPAAPHSVPFLLSPCF